MSISSESFVSNSLTGTIVVKNGFANIDLGTIPYAFEGDKPLTIKLRKGGETGPVIATTPLITIKDNATAIAFIANNYVIAEGDQIDFTLTTKDAPNNIILYYDTIATTANVTTEDFDGANSGSFTLVDNAAKITLKANVDEAALDETGEKFRLSIRTGSVLGNVVLLTDNVSILDTSNVSSYFITQTSNVVTETGNVAFTVNTINVSNGTVLYYTTAGTAKSYNFTTGNTGSVVIYNNSNTITLTPTAIPKLESREFILQVRENSETGTILSSAQNVTMYDADYDYLQATGGTSFVTGGFKYHVFTSTANLVISSAVTQPFTMQTLIVGGGGGGGSRIVVNPGNDFAGGGGGAGGLIQTNVIVSSANVGTHVVTVGSGGVTGTPGNPSSIFNITATGGGGAPGSPGGSGGGGRYTVAGGSGISGQGRAGGSYLTPFPGMSVSAHGSAGGGGAGGVGQNAPNNGLGIGYDRGGNGGIGVPISWVPASYGTTGPQPGRYFSGGGSGGGFDPLTGGAGGGGSQPSRDSASTSGVTNTGGGGAGSHNFTGASGGPGIVIVRYPYIESAYYLSENKTILIENQTITFNIVTTNVSNGKVLYYKTKGNVSSSNFVESNTGSVTIISNSANIVLTANSMPANETREFNLEILEGSTDGDSILLSNTIILADSNAVFPQITGGTVITSGNYKIHVFDSTSNVTISSIGLPAYRGIEYLVVGGGGAGGSAPSVPNNGQSGGGAGGFLAGNFTLTNENVGEYTVTVGGGSSVNPPGDPVRGTPSVLGASGNPLYIQAIGGGGGSWQKAGQPGGSGGGGSYPTPSAGSGTSGQGNPGGAGYFNTIGFGGGGGGAGEPGYGSTPTPQAGYGGNGRPNSWIPASYGTPGPAPGRWFAGGGAQNSGRISGAGSGVSNSGGGGRGQSPGGGATNGSSGIVAIRYLYQ